MAHTCVDMIDKDIFQEVIVLVGDTSMGSSAAAPAHKHRGTPRTLPPDKQQIVEAIVSVFDILFAQQDSNQEDSRMYSYRSRASPAYITKAHDTIVQCDLSMEALSTLAVDITGEVTIATPLSSILLDKLRVVDKLYSRLSNLSTRGRREESPVNCVLRLLVTWCRALLRLVDLQQKMTVIVGLEAGAASIVLANCRRNVMSSLNAYMDIQRVHTAHHYIIRPSCCTRSTSVFLASEQDLVSCYDALCSANYSRALTSEAHSDTQPYHAIPYLPTGDHKPCRQCNGRVPSAWSFEEMWWWDAMRVEEWPLVRRLTRDILRHERADGLELLVVEMVRRHVPVDIVAELCAGGAVFGRVTEHLEIAVEHAEPDLFLLIFMCGSFTVSVEWWDRMIDLFHTCGKRGQGYVRNISHGLFASKAGYLFENIDTSGGGSQLPDKDASRCLDVRRAVLLEILLSGRDYSSSMINKHRMASSIWSSTVILTKVYTLEELPAPAQVVVTPDVNSKSICTSPLVFKSEGNDDVHIDDGDSSSASSDCALEDCAIYQSSELTSRHVLGGYLLVVRQQQNHSLSTLGIDGSLQLTGLLGVHNKPIMPLLLDMSSTAVHTVPLEEFLRNANDYMCPYDRFLCCLPLHHTALPNTETAQDHRCNSVIIGGPLQQALLRHIIGRGSPMAIHSLLETWRHLPVDIHTTLVACSHAGEGDGETACSVIEYCARTGNASAVRRLLAYDKHHRDKRAQKWYGDGYVRRSSPYGRRQVNPALMMECMAMSYQRELLECQERKEQLVSALRGYVNHMTSPQSGSIHRVMAGTLPVGRIIQNVHIFCNCCLGMMKCDVPFAQLLRITHMSRPPHSDNHLSFSGPDMTAILSTIGVEDTISLADYIRRGMEYPFATLEQSATALQNNPLTRDYDPLLYVELVEGSSADQPEHGVSIALYRQWTNSLTCVLGNHGVDLLQLCSLMRDMCLLGCGSGLEEGIKNWNVDISDRKDSEKSSKAFVWFDSAEGIIREECKHMALMRDISEMTSTVKANVRMLQTCPDHYLDDIRSANELRQGEWFTDVSMPLLCVNASDIMRVLAHHRQKGSAQNSFDLEDTQIFTSKTLYHVVSTLLGLPLAGVDSVCAEDVLVRLVAIAEQIVREVTGEAAALPHALLTYQLRDTLLAQSEEVLQCKIDHLKSVFALATCPADSIRYQEHNETILRLNQGKVNFPERVKHAMITSRHLLVFMKACRRWIGKGLSQVGGAGMCRRVDWPSNKEHPMWTVLVRAVQSGSVACVHEVMCHMKEVGLIDLSHTNNVLRLYPVNVWRSAFVGGHLDIVRVLLGHEKSTSAGPDERPPEGQENPMDDERLPESVWHKGFDVPDRWSLLHCLFTGCYTSLEAGKYICRTWDGCPSNGSCNRMGPYTCRTDRQSQTTADCVEIGRSGREREAIFTLLQDRGCVMHFMKPIASHAMCRCEVSEEGVQTDTIDQMDQIEITKCVSYSLSVVDILALRGMWTSVEYVMDVTGNALFPAIAGAGALLSDCGAGGYCTSVLLHCAMLDGRHSVLGG